MIAQEIQIEIFLANPTDELFSLLNDKELALKLLGELPDCVKKCYFLWCKGHGYTRINLIHMCLREGNSEIFYKLMSNFSKKIVDRIIEYAAKYGRVEEMKFLLKNFSYSKLFVNLAEYAAEGNHRKLLIYLIDQLDDDYYIDIAYNAAEYGHQELVNYLIDENGSCNEYDVLARIAIGNKHLSLFKDMIERCPDWNIITTSDNVDDWFIMDGHEWNYMASGVAEGGYKVLLNKIIDRGANDWKFIAKHAASGGQREIVLDMIRRGATNWNEIAECAINNGHIDIVMDMINRGADNWNHIAYNAAGHGNITLVNLAIDNGADVWKEMVNFAMENNHTSVIRRLMEIEEVDNSMILISAAEYGNKEIVDLILSEKYGLE